MRPPFPWLRFLDVDGKECLDDSLVDILIWCLVDSLILIFVNIKSEVFSRFWSKFAVQTLKLKCCRDVGTEFMSRFWGRVWSWILSWSMVEILKIILRRLCAFGNIEIGFVALAFVDCWGKFFSTFPVTSWWYKSNKRRFCINQFIHSKLHWGLGNHLCSWLAHWRTSQT